MSKISNFYLLFFASVAFLWFAYYFTILLCWSLISFESIDFLVLSLPLDVRWTHGRCLSSFCWMTACRGDGNYFPFLNFPCSTIWSCSFLLLLFPFWSVCLPVETARPLLLFDVAVHLLFLHFSHRIKQGFDLLPSILCMFLTLHPFSLEHVHCTDHCCCVNTENGSFLRYEKRLSTEKRGNRHRNKAQYTIQQANGNKV